MGWFRHNPKPEEIRQALQRLTAPARAHWSYDTRKQEFLCIASSVPEPGSSPQDAQVRIALQPIFDQIKIKLVDQPDAREGNARRFYIPLGTAETMFAHLPRASKIESFPQAERRHNGNGKPRAADNNCDLKWQQKLTEELTRNATRRREGPSPD